MTPWTRAALLTLTLVLGSPFPPLQAQNPETIELKGTGDRIHTIRLRWDRGFAAVWVGALSRWGWDVDARGDSAVALAGSGARVVLRAGTPFLLRNGVVRQLADAPYVVDRALFVPVQALGELVGVMPVSSSQVPEGADGNTSRPIVIVDPGHGGRDLGTVGYGGTLEKDVTLGLALALERELAVLGLEPRLTRTGDVLVPVWERGPLATSWKGDRPGVLLSLHVNANPHSRTVRGLETYFLAEARTEHERRLAALENAAGGPERPMTLPDQDLSVILNELRNLDYQRWSARLAELVHAEVGRVHPGPDLGVRQAPLAVLTTALMPSVLVEIGYVTNRAEEELLSRPDFQNSVAAALARAVAEFLDAYPPRGPDAVGGRPQ